MRMRSPLLNAISTPGKTSTTSSALRWVPESAAEYLLAAVYCVARALLPGALGHIAVQCGGPLCTCGRRGCLEAYANAAALLRYAGSRFKTVQHLVEAAQTGTSEAVQAVRVYAEHLSMGIAWIARILDPELVILSGEITQGNELLCSVLEEALARVMKSSHGKPRVRLSPLGYYGGVLGAAALVFEDVCS